jgi:propionyl-CoA carboxylase alpha chain/3-methylcrotonyl-CoA carboxylase alpha subunit/acetyl-CoA/propionyl-CoA carboxylase biotin carboxyl carrier protein
MSGITKVLIANRGEIACRILRSLRRMAIPAVAVYHSIDADSPAVRQSEESMEIDGPTPVAAYLNADAIVAACRKSGADAVHPGFGFLSENPDFARRLAEEGIAFIGPGPDTIELMGNKVAARSYCMAHGFPVAPSVTEAEPGGDFIRRAREVGFPLVIKAASGGGGKGMHIVHHPEDLEQAINLAKGEALRSFGDDALYAERYLENPRHIEVQVVGDHYGNVIHLGERECSIQRRFQKIIEETPAPNLDPALRERICSAAMELALKARYRNAGTVEFLLSGEGEFFFLEMNTRIQVEHPVTEMVTGIDLVELQVRIAQGERLPRELAQAKARGHAIEVRLYAEDPEDGFMPCTGQLLRYLLPEGEGVRVDSGFEEGMHVSSAFDPMLAKLIFHGSTRNQAIERGLSALRRTAILGVTTNADYLGAIVSHPHFKDGMTHTGFVRQHEEELRPPPLAARERDLLLAAAALSGREFIDPAFDVPEPYAAIGGWRN